MLSDILDFVATQTAHGAVTTLNDTVGQMLELMRQDVAGDCGEPIVII